MKYILIIIIISALAFFVFAAPKVFKNYDLGKKISALSEKKTITSAPKTIIKTYSPAQSKIPADIKTITSFQEISDSRIPFGYTREQLSPYFEKIRIISAFSGIGFLGLGGQEQPVEIKIYANLYGDDSAINITGWRVKSNRREFAIPGAIEIYKPSGLNGEKDIILTSSAYVNIYSNTSVINKNFRLNKCTGYLENYYDFNPSLPQNCPLIYGSRYEISHLSGECQNYLFSLGGCKAVDYFFYNSLPGNDQGNACRAFLNTVATYGNCFQKYSQDKDFLSGEWRIWVNQQNFLDSQHDRLGLFDKDGLLVSDYVY